MVMDAFIFLSLSFKAGEDRRREHLTSNHLFDPRTISRSERMPDRRQHVTLGDAMPAAMRRFLVLLVVLAPPAGAARAAGQPSIRRPLAPLSADKLSGLARDPLQR